MNKYITYNNILFLHTQETYEVRKGQTGTIQYYTHADTGESGMSIRGLANACGISHKSLREFLEQTTIFEEVGGKLDKNDNNSLNKQKKEVGGKLDICLIESDDLHVIRDIFCERVIYYYAFESKHKKIKARELYQTLAQHGLRQFIHSKTGYQSQQTPNHDASIELSIEEQLKRENEELKLKLVETEEQLATQVEENRVLKYRPNDEKTYQAYLQGMMGGERELYLSGPFPGRVDLITNQMVLEIKRAANFEYAFGQLLRYRAKLKGTEHENKAYIIYLFGEITTDERRVLDAMAEMASFQLIIERELKDYIDINEPSAKGRVRIVINNDEVSSERAATI